MNILIRPETEKEFIAVYEVNKQAFAQETESLLVEKLRDSKEAVISLVAELDKKIVGHIMLSRMYILTHNKRLPALALAPITVIPEFQKQGIGTALIKKSIENN